MTTVRVQKYFSTTLRSMASPDKVNGKNATFYVNEQNINVFANKVLESVGAALVKEDVRWSPSRMATRLGVSINGKKIVESHW